jgi:hypothetical protein
VFAERGLVIEIRNPQSPICNPLAYRVVARTTSTQILEISKGKQIFTAFHHGSRNSCRKENRVKRWDTARGDW